MCFKCKKPYFGGIQDCAAEMDLENTNTKEDMLCRACLIKDMSIGSNVCDIHGSEFIDWKCMYCCSVAVYCCGGQYFFCGPCHDHPKRTNRKNMPQCKGNVHKCPLGVPHPPPGHNPRKNAFPLGCSLCRSEHLERYDKQRAEILNNLTKEEQKEFIVSAAKEISQDQFLLMGQGKKKGGKGKKGKMPPPQRKKGKKKKK